MKRRALGIAVVLATLLAGSLAAAPDPPPKPSSVAAETLVVTSPLTRQVLQQDDRNRATLTISGHAATDVTSIDARIAPQGSDPDLVGKWTQIAGPGQVVNGEFRGTLPLTAGWYDLHVRGRSGQILVSRTVVPRVGVGEVFVVCGQSNTANHGNTPQTPKEDRVSALTSTGWQQAKDPQPLATGGGGSPWPLLGDLLVQDLNVPVAFASCGYGGTTTQQW